MKEGLRNPERKLPKRITFRPHHAEKYSGIVNGLYQSVVSTFQTDLTRYIQEVVEAVKKDSNYKKFGGPSDVIGTTEDETATYSLGLDMLAREMLQYPDTLPIRLMANHKADPICQTCIIGKHCHDYKTDKKVLRAENKIAVHIWKDITSRARSAATLGLDQKTGRNIVTTTWGALRDYWVLGDPIYWPSEESE